MLVLFYFKFEKSMFPVSCDNINIIGFLVQFLNEDRAGKDKQKNIQAFYNPCHFKKLVLRPIDLRGKSV
jgi:hypothetical protein